MKYCVFFNAYHGNFQYSIIKLIFHYQINVLIKQIFMYILENKAIFISLILF